MIESGGASLVYSDHGREVFACRNVDVVIKPNEFVGILGPSGSGKSSLLYLLSGLKIPTAGRILYEGQDLARKSDEERSRLRLKEFGFLFQQAFLLGYLTALENVLLASDGEPSRQRAVELLDALGLRDKTHRFPHELSGGERQRTCVARALLGNPKVVFADEPTASLDHTNGIHVVDMLNHHREGGALVMVTHDETMLEKADRVLRIAEGTLVSSP